MAQPQRIRQWLSARTIATLAVFSILAACTPGGRDARPGQAGPPKPVEKPTGPDEADRQQVAVLVPTTGPNAALGQSIAHRSEEHTSAIQSHKRRSYAVFCFQK